MSRDFASISKSEPRVLIVAVHVEEEFDWCKGFERRRALRATGYRITDQIGRGDIVFGEQVLHPIDVAQMRN